MRYTEPNTHKSFDDELEPDNHIVEQTMVGRVRITNIGVTVDGWIVSDGTRLDTVNIVFFTPTSRLIDVEISPWQFEPAPMHDSYLDSYAATDKGIFF